MKEYSLTKILLLTACLVSTGLSCFFAFKVKDVINEINEMKDVTEHKDKIIEKLQSKAKQTTQNLPQFTNGQENEVQKATTLVTQYYEERYNYKGKEIEDIPTKVNGKLSLLEQEKLEKELDLFQDPKAETQATEESRFNKEDFQLFVTKKNETELHLLAVVKIVQVIQGVEYPYEIVQVIELTSDEKKIERIDTLPIKAELDRSYD